VAVVTSLARLVNNVPTCLRQGSSSISSQAHCCPPPIVEVLVVVIVTGSVMTMQGDPMQPTIIVLRICHPRRTGRQASPTLIVYFVIVIIDVAVTSQPPTNEVYGFAPPLSITVAVGVAVAAAATIAVAIAIAISDTATVAINIVLTVTLTCWGDVDNVVGITKLGEQVESWKYEAQIVIFRILATVNRFSWISRKAESC
jgi:hypothetical protein